MVEEAVTPEQIAAGGRALDRHPGRPMLEGEREKLLRMEEALGERVIGQYDGGRGGVERRAAGAGGAATTRTGRWARSSSSARPASARPS